MTPSLVTIGIAAYNARATVERAVRSALAQDWRPVEIVVVDDGSSDETGAVLQRLASEHAEIRVFTQDRNGGVASARNRILDEARGAFVCFFDDDDESLPHRVRAQLARLLDYEAAFAAGAPVVCHTARRLIYPDGAVRIAPAMGQPTGVPAPSGLAVARMVLMGRPLENGHGACPTCSQMARLSVFRALGGFDPAFRRCEDTEFCVRLARAGGHFVGLGDPLVIQTMTPTSDKSLESERAHALALIDKHRDFFATEVEYRFTRRWMVLKHSWLMRRRLRFGRQLARLGLTHPARTARRLLHSLPNLGLNRAFRHFHAGLKDPG